MTDAISRAAVLAILKTMPPGMEKQFGRLTRKVEALPGVGVDAPVREALGDMVAMFSADNVLRKGAEVNAALSLSRAALDQITATPAETKTPGL